MKRTDKYRDSYKYDDQYQNHRKRSEEDMYRQHQESQQRANSNRATQSEMIEYENHPERYYNGRDYRREQQLEEENEKSSKTKNG